MEKQSKEVWKDIPGYAGRYQASDQGRIRSFCKDANGRILRGTLNMGYRSVNLHLGEGKVVATTIGNIVNGRGAYSELTQ